MAPILLVLAGVITACTEPVAPFSPGAVTEAAVLAPSNRAATVAPFAIEAATIETRYWNSLAWWRDCGYACWQPGFPGASTPVSYFNGLPRNVAGYTNRPVALSTLTCSSMTPGTPSSAARYAGCISNPGDGTSAAHSDVAMRYRVLLVSTSDLAIRVGVDFMGGVLMDGSTIVAQNWDDPAWNGWFDSDMDPCDPRCTRPSWESDPWGTLVAKIPAGRHELVLIGFENGSEYGIGVQIAGADSVWRDVTSKNIKQTLSLSTNAGGRITGANGLTCASSCTALLGWGSMPALTAAPDPYHAFVAWRDACAATPSALVCEPLMDSDQSVGATFERVQWPLAVSRTGAGQGTVTSANNAINCGLSCLAGFAMNSSVVLTATANATSSDFLGWSGAGCAGTGACTVTMSEAQSVTANFAWKRFPLSVSTVGTGTVTSSSGGVNCGTSCAAEFDYGTAVTLTAVPATGFSFAGWTGACVGTGPCVVTMSQARTVTATFNVSLPPPPVSSCEATPSVLWPANHKMVAIAIKPLPGFTLRSVTSSEPDDAPDGGAPGNEAAGDGATVDDVQGWTLDAASFSGTLRAERDGRGQGRTYSFVYANGAARATCSVFVPRDQSK